VIPTFILFIWLRGLLAFAIFGAAVWLGHEWYQRSWSYDPVLQQSFFDPHFGANEPTAYLAGALGLLLIALAGGFVIRTILRLTGSSTGKSAATNDDPRIPAPEPAARQRLRRLDGSELEVEFYGPEEAPPIILSHGWGLDGDEWNYLKRELSDRFRLIIWDEPGLGNSSPPSNRDYSLEKLARDLEAVLALAGNRPAVLLGHSIGGMITLTFCRLFPEALGTRVAGLLLTHTTYTNPVRTVLGASFFTAIEKPVLVPLMYLTIALSPLVRLMNWSSYRNGSMHLTTKWTSFGGTETWEQIDFAARFQLKAPPAVLARGMLGMMRYDATATLGRIEIPVLVVAGDRDPVCKPEASQHMRDELPNAQLATLTPARHLGLIEHHRRYGEVVSGFVASAVQTPVQGRG